MKMSPNTTPEKVRLPLLSFERVRFEFSVVLYRYMYPSLSDFSSRLGRAFSYFFFFLFFKSHRFLSASTRVFDPFGPHVSHENIYTSLEKKHSARWSPIAQDASFLANERANEMIFLLLKIQEKRSVTKRTEHEYKCPTCSDMFILKCNVCVLGLSVTRRTNSRLHVLRTNSYRQKDLNRALVSSHRNRVCVETYSSHLGL